MQANKKIMLLLALTPLILLPLACDLPQEPVKIILPSDLIPVDNAVAASPAEIQQSGSVDKRFQNITEHDPTTVDSMIELTRQYRKLTEGTARLQKENDNLIAKNRNLKNQVATLDAKLQQTEKELADASDLLREMVVELNNWKVNILGFQEEMRGADKAQLQALLKIYSLLGGEAKPQSPKGKISSSDAVSQDQPQQISETKNSNSRPTQ